MFTSKHTLTSLGLIFCLTMSLSIKADSNGSGKPVPTTSEGAQSGSAQNLSKKGAPQEKTIDKLLEWKLLKKR